MPAEEPPAALVPLLRRELLFLRRAPPLRAPAFLRAAPFRAPPLRADDLRAVFFRAPPLRADDFRAPPLRAELFRPPFFAAMIESPIGGQHPNVPPVDRRVQQRGLKYTRVGYDLGALRAYKNS